MKKTVGFIVAVLFMAMNIAFANDPTNDPSGNSWWFDVPVTDTQAFDMRCEYRVWVDEDSHANMNVKYPVWVRGDAISLRTDGAQRNYNLLVRSSDKGRVIMGGENGAVINTYLVHKLEKRCSDKCSTTPDSSIIQS